MAKITYIYKTSPFYGKAKVGDELLAINGNPIRDLLDYMFFTQSESEMTEITVCRNGKKLQFTEEVTEGDLRFDFDSFLMDKQQSCKNKCIFCFIDQLPKGMRETLYYKDDDFRLSLLYGNYVTLTNVSDEDFERIIDLRVSPINVSVHTTDPELRVMMMKNPNAAKINEQLSRMRSVGINLRCQIVLCPDVNDGEHLDKTMRDLKALHPEVSSVSVVPVGLTKYRDGLYPLRPFTKEEAQRVIDQVNSFGDKCKEELGSRIFYVADEFYLKAEAVMPGYDYYEDFEQLENGVGMTISFAQEFLDIMKTVKKNDKEIRITMITGEASYDLIKRCIDLLKTKFTNLKCDLIVIKNNFFGENITVTGLITGNDVISQLKEKNLGDYLLIPDTMLRDNVFLDDVTVNDVKKALNVKVKTVSCGAEDMIDAISRCARRSAPKK